MTDNKEPPSPYPTLLIERADGCALVTLNRPDKLNALNRQLREDFTSALEALAADDAVRVVILTGAGRAFSAGMDLKEFAQAPPIGEAARGLSPFDALEAMAKPVIGAINGFAITGGMELALGCDLLIASPEARFADTHAALSIMPGAGMSQKLSRILGQPRAMAISLTGDFISAEQALAWGLVSQVVAAEELLPLAWRLARRIAEVEPLAAMTMKRLIKEGGRATLAEGLAMEKSAHEAWAQGGRRTVSSQTRERVMNAGRGKAG